MGRERSDGGMVNNKEKRRFALRRGKNFKNGGEGLEFFILQNFSDCLFLAPPSFCFYPDFPADSSGSSHGNLSFWKPQNLVY